VADAEMQLAACDIFLQILDQSLVPLNIYATTFLQTILMCVDNKDPDIAAGWLSTLLCVIDLLPKDIVSKEILGKAIAKGQLQQPVQSRIACCKILGALVAKFEQFTIKRDILPTVLTLCEDVDHEVRACMAHLLDPVARSLGVEETKASILTELVELSNDEQSHVRLAALDAVVSIMSLLDNEARVLVVIPLISKYCQDTLQRQDSTVLTVAQHFGRLYEGVAEYLSDEQRKYFIDFFKKLCRFGLVVKKASIPQDGKADARTALKTLPPIMLEEFGASSERGEESHECRRWAAYNFPAMVQLVGLKSFKVELAASFTLLCNDPSIHVRVTAAAGFHEVAKTLGVNATWIIGDLIQLLRDNSTEVLGSGVLVHMPETLEAVCRGGKTISSESKCYDVLYEIVASEAVVFNSNNWRLQEAYMTMLRCLPRCFSSDLIFMKVVPLVFRKLSKARALPVRRAAVRSLLLLLRANCHVDQREELCSRLIEDFACGRSYHRRSLFIDICLTTLDIYSRAFFKHHFCEPLLRLHSDPVPNVRLRLCEMLPRVKRTMKQPTDNGIVQMLESCVRNRLVHERDRDVINALNRAVNELDQIPVELESQATRRSEEDKEDQRRVEEEKRVLEAEEKDRRQAVSSDLTGANKKTSAEKDKRADALKTAQAKRAGRPIGAAASTAPTSLQAAREAAKKNATARDASPQMSVPRQLSGQPLMSSNSFSTPSSTTGGSKKRITSSLSSGAVSNNTLVPPPAQAPTQGGGVKAQSRATASSPLPEVRKSNVQRHTSFNESYLKKK